MPKQDERTVDAASDTITTTLSYPDPTKNRTGFNPIDYPDLNFTYKVRVHGEGGSIRIMDTTGDVDASTSGGSISIDGATGHVKAHTAGGHIEARDIMGAIDASTSGGSVTASLRAQPGPASVTRTARRSRAYVPRGPAPRMAT